MKYGILKKNIYNFNKIRFLIGQIMIIIIIINLNKAKSPKLTQFSNRKWVSII